MEFLVRVETRLPDELPEYERADLLAHEAARGRELVAAGTLRHIWRLPGRLANVAIWSAGSVEELHDALVSLPVWPYAEIEVTALAAHPLTQAVDKAV
ncbi:MAG: Muconolactone delta-isomerase [Actinoallomurus sp.]|nr:Muconolactone delta-isomerase [Actinoallomurus sp.]